MQVSQILPDAQRIFAKCSNAELFDKVYRAVVELINSGEWDWATVQQYIILNCESTQNQHGYITLPRFVEMPLAMNLDCFPAFPRNKWFNHHINGPGERTNINCYRSFWDDKGEFCTLRNMTGPAALVAANLNPLDAGLSLRVYGLDQNGNEVYDSTGVPGILLPMNSASSVIFSSVTSIYRPLGAGVITLTQTTDQNLIGYYYPDEIDPRYRRVRIPQACKTVTLTYKRALPQIFYAEDWIPINNLNALITGLWYIFYIDHNDYEKAELARSNAVRSLKEEEARITLKTPVGPQIQQFATRQATDNLYGGYAYGNNAAYGPLQ